MLQCVSWKAAWNCLLLCCFLGILHPVSFWLRFSFYWCDISTWSEFFLLSNFSVLLNTILIQILEECWITENFLVSVTPCLPCIHMKMHGKLKLSYGSQEWRHKIVDMYSMVFTWLHTITYISFRNGLSIVVILSLWTIKFVSKTCLV